MIIGLSKVIGRSIGQMDKRALKYVIFSDAFEKIRIKGTKFAAKNKEIRYLEEGVKLRKGQNAVREFYLQKLNEFIQEIRIENKHC